MALYSPLDLDSILLLDLAGSESIFIYLALMALGFGMGKFNLPSKLMYPIFVLFAIVMAVVSLSFYVLVIILAALFVFYSIGRAWR